MSGIQSLLKTEKEAAEIVNEARKYRTSRLKSAKQDAQKEIDEYKKLKESELDKYEKEHSGLNESTEKEADAAVQKELETIKGHYNKKKLTVVEQIVAAATEPKPEIHINAKA
ncbi:V-type proton ATPase subunit G [Diutina catenulata]